MRLVYVLLILIIPIGEIHKLFCNIQLELDVFLFSDYKLDLEWIVKDVSEEIQTIMLTYVAYRISTYLYGFRPVRDILFALFVFSWVDLAFYFIAFKTGYFAFAYYFLALFILLRKWAKKKPFQSGMKVALKR